jgi:hypothetical protein
MLSLSSLHDNGGEIMKKLIMLMSIGILLEMPLVAFAQESLLRNHKAEAESATDSTAVELGIKSLSRAQLDRLPFRGAPAEYYGLFSGTVVQDYRGIDFVHVRGSRQDEIGYAFEGADGAAFHRDQFDSLHSGSARKHFT